MILKEEIQRIATAKKLGIDIVEKDYILSWVLAGIHHHTATKNSWVFKGGTCLKNVILKRTVSQKTLTLLTTVNLMTPPKIFTKIYLRNKNDNINIINNRRHYWFLSKYYCNENQLQERTIDNKIKVYDSIISSWIKMRNLIYRKTENNTDPSTKWFDLDQVYGESQTFIGEIFLVSDNVQLAQDINTFNEKFYRSEWHKLSIEQLKH